MTLSFELPERGPTKAPPPCIVDRHQVEMHTSVSEWARYERELCAAGVPLPATWRSAWVRHHDEVVWFATAADIRDARCGAAAALRLTPTRALPGHFIARGEHIGPGRSVEARSALLRAIVRWAESCPRMLRLELETFSRDARDRAAMGDELGALGMSRSLDPRMYESTSIVDLTGSEEALLARFHPSVRRHLRATTRHAELEVRAITSAVDIPAMALLVDQTRRRTHGGSGQRPWGARLRVAAEAPDLLAVVGLFHKDDGRLLAFASGQRNGDHVMYADAASTRSAELRIPLGYAPAWELMRWARRHGARWFDFGGITGGSAAPGDGDDPIAGISAFKRHFGGTDERVSEEWALEPRPTRARVAHAVSAGAEWLRARGRALETWRAADRTAER